MILLSTCYTSNEFDEVGYSMVEIDVASAQRLLHLWELAQLCNSFDDSFSSVHLWDDSCSFGEWYDPRESEEDQGDIVGVELQWIDEEVGGGSWVEISSTLGFEHVRTGGGGRIVVSEYGVSWENTHKHSSDGMGTPEINWSAVREIADGGHPFKYKKSG